MALSPVRIPIFAQDKTARAFARVKKGLKGLGRFAVTTAKRMAQLGTAMAAAAAVGGVALVRSQMQAIDALGKVAQKIGATTEALGALQYAGELTGIKTETMNMALQRFTRRVSEASAGTGEAKDALHELGLNASQLLQLPLDQQMMRVADAFEKVPTQADRVRLSFKLFDSEGVAMINTLMKGSGELGRMMTEAEKLGIILNDVDVEKVEDANNQLTAAFKIFDGIAKKFTAEISPFIAEIAERLRQAALDSEDFGNIGVKAARAVISGLGSLAGWIHEVRIGLKYAELAWDSFEVVARLALQTILSPITAVINGINAIRETIGLPFIDNPIAGMLEEGVRELRTTQAELDELLATVPDAERWTVFFDEIVLGARRRVESIGETVGAAGAGENTITSNLAENVKRRTLLVAQEQKARVALEKFKTLSTAEQAQQVLGVMQQQFSDNKALSVAQALINTYVGATLALKSYPGPLGVAMAAMTYAAGMKQVQAIRAQSFEGGGFTGSGPRSGGIDGKGGFLGVLHPNEQILDHTRGGGAPIVINNTVDASGADPMVDQKIRIAMQEASMQTIAAIGDLRRRGRGP